MRSASIRNEAAHLIEWYLPAGLKFFAYCLYHQRLERIPEGAQEESRTRTTKGESIAGQASGKRWFLYMLIFQQEGAFHHWLDGNGMV